MEQLGKDLMTRLSKDLHQKGVKDDSGKVMGALIGDFGLALMEVGKIGTYGANKYTRGGWESVPDGIQRYEDAMWRHLLMHYQEGIDPESGYEHELHMVWNALAKLELRIREKNSNDNRTRTISEGIPSPCQPTLPSRIHTEGQED